MLPLFVLHGAIGAASQMQDAASRFNADRLLIPDLPGHGSSSAMPGRLSIESFAGYLLEEMDRQTIEKADFFGYSMGGYIALYLASRHPSRVGKVITLATKLSWTPAIAEKEVSMLNPDKISEKLPAFAQTLSDRHGADRWRNVLTGTQDMLLSLGAMPPLGNSWEGITTEVLLMVGDRDRMVGVEETAAVYRQMPNAEFAVLPGTPHPVEQVDTENLGFFVNRFLQR